MPSVCVLVQYKNEMRQRPDLHFIFQILTVNSIKIYTTAYYRITHCKLCITPPELMEEIDVIIMCYQIINFIHIHCSKQNTPQHTAKTTYAKSKHTNIHKYIIKLKTLPICKLYLQQSPIQGLCDADRSMTVWEYPVTVTSIAGRFLPKPEILFKLADY